MDIFDMIGPIMIGPSSSHTAGAVRLGRVAWKTLGEEPVLMDIGLAGSYARTYRGHGTDQALIAGCMGMHSYDERIRRAMDIARERGIEYSFRQIRLNGAHPNTALIRLVSKSGTEITVQGASIGGGNIRVDLVNGMEAGFTGERDTYLVRHWDRPGVIADVTEMISRQDLNIANIRLSRQQRGGEALIMLEIDGTAPPHLVDLLAKLPNVTRALLIRAL